MSRTVVMNNKFIPSDFLPIGFLGYLPYSAVPAGWLVCDGTVYTIADYPELAAKLGSTYGGDGVATFAVPDDRGLFRRGLDLSKGYDAGRVLGSEQDQDVQPHTHPNGVYSPGGGGGFSTASIWKFADWADSGLNTGAETRPKNRAYVPIIKAKNIYYDLTVQGGNAASLGGNPASYYAANSLAAKYTDFTGTFAASGYRRLPDGTILQWGYDAGVNQTQIITFPVAFTSACYSVVSTYCATSTAYQIVTALSPTSVTFFRQAGSVPFYWLAIGR